MLELYPESAEARLRIGEIYMMMDKNKEAIWQLEDAIQLDPLNVEVRRVRGTLFFLDGNYEKAAEDFKIAVKYANIEAKSKPIQELQEVQRVQELYYYLGLSCYHSGPGFEITKKFVHDFVHEKNRARFHDSCTIKKLRTKSCTTKIVHDFFGQK